jgi:hypothetical protein
MVKQSSAPAAIEGSKIQLIGQRIRPGALPIKTTANIVMFPIHAYQRAVGTIIEESDPKIPKLRNYAMLDKDDEVSGKKLWGLTCHPLKSLLVGGLGRTSAHPGQDLTLNGSFCFLEIVEGWRGLPLLRHPQNDLKQITLSNTN